MKFIATLLLLPALLIAQAYTDMYTIDATDRSKPIKLSMHMTICDATLGTYYGLYIKSYQRDEKHRTCEELAPQFEHVTINPYSTSKRKSGNAGSIGFGKRPQQCHLELENVNGKVTGTLYGDKAVCSGIRSEGTIVLEKNEKQKPYKKEEPAVSYVLKILKYGGPQGTGRSFTSQSQCNKEQARLSKVNAGLDYSYKCVRKKR